MRGEPVSNIDDAFLADRFRSRLLRGDDKSVLIAALDTSLSASDKYTIANCAGYGRIREFRDYKLYLERAVFPDRPLRPNFRGYPPNELVRTQVFQLAGCNWRCWYCFVDDNRLSANPKYGKYFTAAELVDLYLAEPNHPDIIDLSGGQPDLVPEWALWMVDECDKRGILDTTYIWIDDNLSNDFLFRFLTRSQIARLASVPKLSRMGCFKGFDEASFTFTTRAPPERFQQQFETTAKIIDAGFRFYAYATFTAADLNNLEASMRLFVDRLQEINELLPLRTTPLKVYPFAVTTTRQDQERARSLVNQLTAFAAWDSELRRRYPAELLTKRPDEIA